MKLYFAPDTRAVRTAWLMYELGLDFELHRFEKLGDPAMRAPEFLEISPNGRIPVLEDGDVRIFESPAIAEYLVARHGQGKLVPPVESPAFPQYLQWLHYGEGMITGPMNNYVVETIILKPERRSEEHAKRALKLMTRMVQTVDAHMADRDYLAGDFTAADTITGHACIMCEKFGVDFSGMPNLKAYVDRLQARPAAQKAFAL
ncbi:glutathione S-transferase family protein [Mameliella sp. AT18]|uniref:glutathione S-transferase family protein n=1 Tax=Mameliella sp. AT18 TaxID=3028385 RepID=UPI0009F62183|nr:glutathione S-transferase family protein [Mameliella sp. AT18]MDD9731495.1 glutathione S-transferase family protein [Mameliella sp. AT18]